MGHVNLKQRGTYLLILTLKEPKVGLKIGRKLQIDFEAGYYGYVGSALGGGGLASRLRRHASANKQNHWHIDYLLASASLKGALVKADKRRFECDWSAWINQRAIKTIGRFGSSDCPCSSHLFYLGDLSRTESLIELAQIELEGLFLDVVQL